MSTGAATRVVLIGGSSDIGLAIVARLRREGPVTALLLGRDPDRMAVAADGLRAAGIEPVQSATVDAEDLETHEPAVREAVAALGGVDIIVHAVGRLGGQAGLDADPREAEEVMRVTFLGAGSLLLHSLRELRRQDRGTLIVLSSVAAERARAGNVIYGAAKAGFDALAQGLADETAQSGVRVLVVRPGFVKSKMTAGLEPSPMSSTPEQVAAATVAALSGSAHTIWVPGRLRWVFAVLRHLPRPVFRRLPLG
jgi:decaprenylphospho-beta-D-erythro-pentofuranosid-2-ulose 2-reductase